MPDRVRHHTHGEGEIVRAIPVHEGAKIIIDQERPPLQVIRRDDPTALNGMRQRTAIRTTHPALLPALTLRACASFNPSSARLKPAGNLTSRPQPMPACQPSLDK